MFSAGDIPPLLNFLTSQSTIHLALPMPLEWTLYGLNYRDHTKISVILNIIFMLDYLFIGHKCTKMADSEVPLSCSLSIDSIKVIAESIGINSLADDAAKELADDITYRLKVIVQDATKFMFHSKGQKLSTLDIDNALRLKNMEVSN